MSGFHNERLSLPLSLGANGGPEWRTQVTQLASGRELRNAQWARGRRRWDLGGVGLSLGQMRELSDFFNARQGRRFGFRFRDPLDWNSCAPDGVISATDQIIGTGDGTTAVFQLSKSSVGQVTRPVPETVKVALDGVEQSNGWAVDDLTGLVTFDAPPATNEMITAGFEFDIPVRFDVDALTISFDAPNAVRVASLPIIEIT